MYNFLKMTNIANAIHFLFNPISQSYNIFKQYCSLASFFAFPSWLTSLIFLLPKMVNPSPDSMVVLKGSATDRSGISKVMPLTIQIKLMNIAFNVSSDMNIVITTHTSFISIYQEEVFCFNGI